MSGVSANSPAYRETEITSAGAPVVLSCYDAGPEAAVVLFLPGTMVHPLFYDAFLRRLAASGYNVVGLHFLSHGKSPRIREDFVFADLLQNVRDAIGWCREHYAGKLFLLGSSQGGILATAAADDPRLDGVLAHDTVLPELDASARVLNLPKGLLWAARPLMWFVRTAARLFPTLQIPMTSYLQEERVTRNEAIIRQFTEDPLSRKSYPLGYLASLFHADMHAALDGSIRCPYVLIAARHDPLFPFDYIETVFEAIRAPEKELMVFDLPYHMLFHEAETESLERVVAVLKKLEIEEVKE